MRHNVKGRKLKRTKSHRDAMLANMASSLFEHKKIHTTEAKAKELRPYAEHIITKAKTALAREKQHLLPEGQSIDIHNRREVYKDIRNKGVLQELFDSIAPVVENRNGGYLRITKTGTRRGDAGRTAIIEFVDYSAPQDGNVSLKRKRKSTKKSTKQAKPTNVKAVADAQPVEEQVEQVEVENTTENTESIENATENVVVDATAAEVEEVVDTADTAAEAEETPEAEKSEE